MDSVHPVSASLIICSRNRPRFLEECVDSVLAGHTVPDEIVIIDQSNEPHPRFLLSPGSASRVVYRWVEWRNASRARNTGVAMARHPILAFLDDDTRVTPEWLGALVEAILEHGGTSIVTGKVLPTDPSAFVTSIRTDDEPRVHRGRTLNDVLLSNNMGMLRSVYADVDGFDERMGPGTPFHSAEDLDFMYRALMKGYRIVYDPTAVIYHRSWRTMKQYVPLWWRYGVGRGALYAKHMSPHDLYTLRALAHDMWYDTSRFVRYLRRERGRATGRIAHTLGIGYGSLRWTATYRTRPNAGEMHRV